MQAEGAGTAGAVCTQEPGNALGRACRDDRKPRSLLPPVKRFRLVIHGYPTLCEARVTRRQVQISCREVFPSEFSQR
jgi:hypothetical protein